MERDFGKVKWTDEELEARVQEIVASLGGGGGFDLLWKSPDDAMTAVNTQIITLDKSVMDYSLYVVGCRLTNRQDTHGITAMGYNPVWGIKVQTLVETSGLYIRNFVLNYQSDPKSVYCGSCSVRTTLNGSGTAQKSYLIPHYIFGVK